MATRKKRTGKVFLPGMASSVSRNPLPPPIALGLRQEITNQGINRMEQRLVIAQAGKKEQEGHQKLVVRGLAGTE